MPYICDQFDSLLTLARHIIIAILDFFYKPFARILPVQTYRYLACGGTNTVLNILIYDLAYKFILHKHDFHIYDNFNITARVGAYIIAFCISFPAGFTLSRYVVFPESNLHGRIQFFRYALTTATFILLTYLLIKMFAFMLPMVYPAISYMFVCIITAVLSYISQRKFTFKTIEEEIVPD